MKGDYDDDHNDRVCEQGCNRVFKFSVNANVGNNRATPEAANGDAHGFHLNLKLHVVGESGDNPNNYKDTPHNSINMLKQ